MNVQSAIYSLLRYTPNVARGETKNIAVIVVDEARETGLVRAAPMSSVSRRPSEQAMIDAVVRNVARRVRDGELTNAAGLLELASAPVAALSLTIPSALEVSTDIRSALDRLYRAFVGPPPHGRNPLRKGEILDRLMASLTATGAAVSRGRYVGDFTFDALIEQSERPAAIQVLSFAVAPSSSLVLEREAAHMLFGLEHVSLDCTAVVQPPVDHSSATLNASFDRVRRWIDAAGVPMVESTQLPQLAAQYAGTEQLPLLM